MTFLSRNIPPLKSSAHVCCEIWLIPSNSLGDYGQRVRLCSHDAGDFDGCSHDIKKFVILTIEFECEFVCRLKIGIRTGIV